MAKRRGARARRPPKVAYTLLTPEDSPAVYRRLRELVVAHHPELMDANIAVAFHTGWRLDMDGHLKLGACLRASDLHRELHPFDFVVLLNREWFEHDQITAIQRDALLDHELQHATVRRDPDTNEPMRNERGRIVYRIRKHDSEEFHVIPKRWGLWKRDLEDFARALRGVQSRLPIDEGEDDALSSADTTTVN